MLKTSVSAYIALVFMGLSGSAALLCLAAVEDDAAPATAQTTNSIGMRLVQIPAGDFLMGSHESAEKIVAAYRSQDLKAKWYDDEFPQHRVRISRPFQLGMYEVTISEFRQFVEATDYKTEAERNEAGGYGFDATTGKIEGRRPEFKWRKVGWEQTDSHPVVNVTWNDAVAFCDWLSRKESKKYRLPTEAEWESACRAGSNSRFSTGNSDSSLRGAANLLDAAARRQARSAFPGGIFQSWDDGYAFTAPVGKFKANAFGVFDMHGNVWEWCSDWHGKDYYAESPEADPAGPATGTHRVVRGGSWSDNPFDLRASNRSGGTPDDRRSGVGFRVACDAN